MTVSSFPSLSLGILAMLAGGIVCSLARIRRSQAIGIVLTTTLLVGMGVWTTVDAGNAWQPDALCHRLGIDSGTGWMIWVLCLTDLLIVLVAPEQDLRRGIVGGALILSAGNLIAYAAHDLTTMWSGWILGALPFLVGALRGNPAVRSALVPAVGSVLVFGMALVAQAAGARPLTVSTLILIAVALRKGILPFHGWVVRTFAESPLVWIMLLFNGHLGGLLLLRHEIARHGLEHGLVEIASGIVILSSIVCSLRALVEANPRRLLGYLFIGQSGLVVGGVLLANTEGITGALVHWLVVVIASSGLFMLLRILESRISGPDWWRQPQGLGVSAPRLATFFLLFSLTLAGLPGTLGYCSQELLFTGAAEHSIPLGWTLALTSALNAISVFRLFTHLFLGVPATRSLPLPDLLPRERWPLAISLVLLIVTGLFPARVMRLPEAPAHEIVTPSQVPGGAH
jgi:NADH-quinone oxidoreductase subunit M